nr:immunoglobulin heavy chain junction region [Macaca mulatta]MOV54858.1 immunoglobulin heavy chain junction region [Macaca mulatta]MOV55828.1 immunoglobulin heavy chain junction region [Macaca mulatta]MOV56341.1 immunoglobulin heavy chain junction region [Macaca mulatta]MOV56437.1 immunoglobulin heavy chain junction region [Macaca mulatta]
CAKEGHFVVEFDYW